ncbi:MULTISPECIES: heavy-metal-associated domain-containing protein [Azohydromonas]|uniref:Heavy-metal-associated domain-containing protein n=1 Tax=Azohydromonas lata TaxID=45677 RepID=A0ABU5I9D2_9BURK|nr:MULTISPECIES: heavy-metal-associated domain-containing protein [Azohydromonas]MDZ5455716.1 heavy-metal-associated domain-containing protein [Azohydromonas lata]
MIEFTVPEMSCGHCVGAITQALKAADPAARVDVTLADKKVRVQSTLERQALAQALSEAGYEPAAAIPATGPARGGCGCGCR